MSLSKRGNIYWYEFKKNGRRYRDSTGASNKKKAREIEEKVKLDVAQARVGLQPGKAAPTLEEFLTKSFRRYIDQHNRNPRTRRSYEEKIRRLLDWPDWRNARLNEIEDMVPDYIASRRDLANDTINLELAILRKAMILAYRKRLVPRIEIKLLKPSPNRKFVLKGKLETEYLAAADYPLRQAAILILDLGIRPLECVCLKKTHIGSESIMVWDGKSGSRPIPLTQRAKDVIEFLFALHPNSPWLLPSPYDDEKHMARATLTNAHIRLRTKHPEWPRELLLYSGRHTFGTRLAESSGGNPFQIKALMGHASVKTSEKYVHTPSEELALAMKRKESWDQIERGENVPTKSADLDYNPLKTR
jgi:integrase